METSTSLEDDRSEQNLPGTKAKAQHKGHEITSKTIRAPPFSYLCLQLISDQALIPEPDLLSVRSSIAAAMAQFLGLTGSAIAVDLLKLDPGECWIRVPREDLTIVVAAVGGWVGGSESGGRISWKVKAAGNWLSPLVARTDGQDLWNE